MIIFSREAFGMNEKLEVVGLIFLGNEYYAKDIIKLIRLKDKGQKIAMDSIVGYLKQQLWYKSMINNQEMDSSE